MNETESLQLEYIKGQLGQLQAKIDALTKMLFVTGAALGAVLGIVFAHR